MTDIATFREHAQLDAEWMLEEVVAQAHQTFTDNDNVIRGIYARALDADKRGDEPMIDYFLDAMSEEFHAGTRAHMLIFNVLTTERIGLPDIAITVDGRKIPGISFRKGEILAITNDRIFFGHRQDVMEKALADYFGDTRLPQITWARVLR